MTRDKYLEMMDQMGKEPIEDEIPIAWEDFSFEVQQYLNIYNSLGDRVAADIGFLGKDYTKLELLIEVNMVEDKELLLDVLEWLERRAIKESADSMKKERDKIKRKKK